jgi:hypothetical protein
MTQLKNYETPDWATYVFLAGICFLIFSVAKLVEKGKPKAFWPVIGFFVVYVAYVLFAENRGWFNVVSFPPKVLRITTLPMVLFLFLVLVNTQFWKELFSKLKVQDLVKVHLFRVVGGMFIVLALHDALPKTFAFIAGCGDVITALCSIYVAKQIEKGAKNAKTLTYVWNTFGFIDIIFTAVMANYLTKVSIDTGVMGVDTLARFPFCLIPALAPPLIWFLHSMIYKKLNEWDKVESK